MNATCRPSAETAGWLDVPSAGPPPSALEIKEIDGTDDAFRTTRDTDPETADFSLLVLGAYARYHLVPEPLGLFFHVYRPIRSVVRDFTFTHEVPDRRWIRTTALGDLETLPLKDTVEPSVTVVGETVKVAVREVAASTGDWGPTTTKDARHADTSRNNRRFTPCPSLLRRCLKNLAARRLVRAETTKVLGPAWALTSLHIHQQVLGLTLQRADPAQQE